jgi:hypothetical protein
MSAIFERCILLNVFCNQLLLAKSGNTNRFLPFWFRNRLSLNRERKGTLIAVFFEVLKKTYNLPERPTFATNCALALFHIAVIDALC